MEDYSAAMNCLIKTYNIKNKKLDCTFLTNKNLLKIHLNA